MSKRKRASRAKRQGWKVAQVTMPPTTWDSGATGPANRAGLITESVADFDQTTGRMIANPNGVKRARRVDMLEVWHRKGVITTAGFNAAERLRDAFESTQRAPGWPDNDRVQSSPKPDIAVTIQIDRLSAYHAVSRLVCAEDRAIVAHCVMGGGSPYSAVIAGRRPYRGRAFEAGMAHLRDALDRLACAMSDSPQSSPDL